MQKKQTESLYDGYSISFILSIKNEILFQITIITNVCTKFCNIGLCFIPHFTYIIFYGKYLCEESYEK